MKASGDRSTQILTGLAAAFKARREALGMSRYRLAKLCGVSAHGIAMIEKGARLPSVYSALQIAGALEFSLGAELAALERAVPAVKTPRGGETEGEKEKISRHARAAPAVE